MCMYWLAEWDLDKRPDRSGVIIYADFAGDMQMFMAMAKTKEHMDAAAEWLRELNNETNMPILARVSGKGDGILFGTLEQRSHIVEWRRKRGCLTVLC